jgi:hypothetical protein
MRLRITHAELLELRTCFQALIGERFRSLSLPIVALEAFEPSQIGTIVGALMDAMIPHLEIKGVGLEKHAGILGDREGRGCLCGVFESVGYVRFDCGKFPIGN